MLDGDEWVINGQKVWTTQGHHADYCFLLTRTDPEAPKHKGISYLLVPMRQPGIEVRGITQPDGTAEFCEVFFDNARCPKDNVVGGVNNGWKVANSTLGFERGQSATTGLPPLRGGARPDGRRRPATGAIDDPPSASASPGTTPRSRSCASTGSASLSATLTGTQGPERRRPRGDEQDVLVGDAPGGDGAGPRHLRRRVDARRRRPADAGRGPATRRDARREGYPVSAMMSAFFFSRSETIWGGTSQIQRNIVGERVLGLPKEPRSNTIAHLGRTIRPK